MARRRSIEKLLRTVNAHAIPEVTKALFAGGEMIAVEAQISITAGAVSGKFHVPSKPGEPPNNDTGVLAGNIETNKIRLLQVEVSSNAPYSKDLEFGTSRIAARPFMAPAANAKRPAVKKLVDKAVKRAVRRAIKGGEGFGGL
jgi:HK97 gp10 family phage protein